VRAFAAAADAMAIGGSVESGATDGVADSSSLLIVQAPVVAPME